MKPGCGTGDFRQERFQACASRKGRMDADIWCLRMLAAVYAGVCVWEVEKAGFRTEDWPEPFFMKATAHHRVRSKR